MRRLHFFLILCMSVMISYGTVLADSVVVEDLGTGHSYQRFDGQIDWHGAKAACEGAVHDGRFGYLATITSQAENDFVYGRVGVDYEEYWLGATEEQKEGTWLWVTGEDWDYTNWGTGQPNNLGADQDYLSFYFVEPSKWNDQIATFTYNAGYICEWDPECTGAGHCDDSNACTVDECVDWECQYSPRDCGDGNECTDDSCEPLSGCVHVCNATDPDDLCCGNQACLGDEVCSTGACGRSAQASTFGKTPAYGASDFMKHLGYLLLPLGAMIGLRIWRRNR